jgi:cytochrome c553
LLNVVVHPADVQDRDGAFQLLRHARQLFPFIERISGEKIFQTGVPEANVAACAACHGPEAQGSGEIPRLAGQLPDYLYNKLINWSKERGQNPTEPDIAAVMSPVAHSLTRPQVEALAAYLSYLK